MGRSRPLADVDQKIVLVSPSSAASFVVLGRRCVPATFSLSAVAASEHDDGDAVEKGSYGATAGCPKKTSRRVELTRRKPSRASGWRALGALEMRWATGKPFLCEGNIRYPEWCPSNRVARRTLDIAPK